MIPLRLSLTNFLSYRETVEVDFHSLHLACIAGANGAGKSTLLDAMIWALFGKSRVSSDDDLVNRGAEKGAMAEVRFTFTMAGSIYRVIRRKRAGKTTELELQQCIDEDVSGRWKTMTEARLGDTQEAIRGLLQMNYDVFTNASFILQDKASDFTVKTPDKRKEVLAEILGVSQWETYRLAASVRRKAAETTTEGLRRTIEEIDVELAQEETRRQVLRDAEQQELALKATLAQCEARLSELRNRKAQADQQWELMASLAASLERARQDLVNTEAGLTRRRAELARAESLLEREATIEERYRAYQDAQRAAVEWQEKADRLVALERERRPHETEIEREGTRLLQQEQTLIARGREVASAAAERDRLAAEIQRDSPRLAAVKAELEVLAGQADAYSDARARLAHVEGERKAWARDLDELRGRLAGWEAMEVEKVRVAGEIEAAELALNVRAEELVRLEQQQQALSDIEAALRQLTMERERITKEGESIRARIDRLTEEQGSTCPLCGQAMTEEHRAAVISQWSAEREERVAAYRSNEAERARQEQEKAGLTEALRRRPRLQTELNAAQNDLGRRQAQLRQLEDALATRDSETTARLPELEKLLADTSELDRLNGIIESAGAVVGQRNALDEERAALQDRVAGARVRLAQAEADARRWVDVDEPALTAIRQQLQDMSYAAGARLALAELDRQAAALGYDPAAHEAARRARAEYADAEAEHHALQTARGEVRVLAETVADLEARRDHWRAQVADTEAQHATAQTLWNSLSAELTEFDVVEREVDRLRDEVVEVVRRVGSARNAVSVLDDQRLRREQLVTERDRATELSSRLKVLEESFGRKGVQAWLIEMALPEIEDRANLLLDRLSNGGMRISFNTQRRLKSKDAVAETLDITIADGVGERPYENYSGGEKFRINFALRLALSQVLAHRAGTQLRTLVIDEGFGSQDPEGRQRLVEAINLVQDEFACILVITHVDELRDAFPARIEVEKTPAGSRVTVVAS